MSAPGEPTFTCDLPIPLGAVLVGKYRLDKLIGAGGMGIVVLGRHLGLDQKVAIKMLRPSAMHDRDVVTRFAREARASTKIQSEHVARIIDVGTTDTDIPIPFIVMEHLVGSDLSAIVKQRGRLPPTEAIDYILQACEALAEAHQMGIVHRDLKPANLFLARRADGSPLIKVLDFGISKSLEATEEDLTKSEMMMGSPHYMSPEQLTTPKSVDSRADIWGLGGVLFRLVAGQPPFLGETAAALCAMVLTETPRRLSSVVPDVPKELDDAIARCLRKHPKDRFATVNDFAQALLPLATEDGRSSIRRIAGVESSPKLPPSIPPPANDGNTLLSPSRARTGSESVSVHVTFGTSTLQPLKSARRRSWATVIPIALVAAAALAFGVIRVKQSSNIPTTATGLVATPPPGTVEPPPPPPLDLAPPPTTTKSIATTTTGAAAAAAAAAPASAPTPVQPSPAIVRTARAPGPPAPKPPAATTAAAPADSAAAAAAAAHTPHTTTADTRPAGTSEYGGRK